MREPASPGVWPAWARYAVFAGLGAILVFGVVSAVVDGVSGAVVRIVLAAVVVPALLLPLRLLGLRRRGDRWRGRLHGELGEVRLLVAQERDLRAAARTTGASDDDLAEVERQVEVLRGRLAGTPARSIGTAVQTVVELARDWPVDAPLARALEQCRRSARGLAAGDRRADGGADVPTDLTTDGRPFRVEPRWKEEVVYWEGATGFVFDAGWGVTPPALYVPSARTWDDVVPEWMQGRREPVVAALRDHSRHTIVEDDHGWYSPSPWRIVHAP